MEESEINKKIRESVEGYESERPIPEDQIYKQKYETKLAQLKSKVKKFFVSIILVYVGVLVIQSFTNLTYPFAYITAGLGIIILIVMGIEIFRVRKLKKALGQI